jgi:FkbM family methyltransferase
VIKRFGRWALGPALGRARLQPLFESLYELSLAGLNFGEGNHPTLSGEKFVMRLIASRLPPNVRPLTIFDVGANVGVYTRELQDVFGDSATIWAFEPSPSSFRMLEAELVDATNVQIRNLGFSDREGEAILHSPVEGSKLASVHDTSTRLARLGTPTPIEEPIVLTTLDRFCTAESLERIHFLKIDVEGHELNVLNGASALLDERRIDAIQFEFSAANLDSRSFFRDFYHLLSGRYRLYRVLQNGLYPIDQYKESYEVFKRATNYLALLDSADQGSR